MNYQIALNCFKILLSLLLLVAQAEALLHLVKLIAKLTIDKPKKGEPEFAIETRNLWLCRQRRLLPRLWHRTGKSAGQRPGVKVKYVSVDAANRAEYLILTRWTSPYNFTVTDERKKQVDFALPYMKVSLGVVSPKKGVITDVKQLEGKTWLSQKEPPLKLTFEKIIR